MREIGRFLAGYVIVTIALASPVGVERVFANFTEIGGVMGVGYAGEGRSVCAGDYDGDGWIDFYVGNVGQPNILYRNRLGDGYTYFQNVTEAARVDNGSLLSWGVVWGDADNDGDLDLYVANDFSGPNHYYRNDGSFFTECHDLMGLGGAINNMGVAWCDSDRDGDLDMYVSILGQNLHYRCDGAFYTDIAPVLGAADSTVGFTAAWADYDNDGDSDLYVANRRICLFGCDEATLGPSKLYRNDGSRFQNVTTAVNPALASEADGASWGDYDNDGDLDLFAAAEFDDHFFRNDGATFTDVTLQYGMNDAGINKGGIWGDYDNDGDLDLFVTGEGQSKLYRNSGSGFSDVAASEGVNDAGAVGIGTGSCWADYDNDGDLDLFVVRRGGTNRLFRNNLGSGNRWMKIDLAGQASNRDGIGARVSMTAGGVTRIREIAAGEGYCSQNSLTADFGLGASATTAAIGVQWPSGIVQTLPNEATNRAITIVEPVPAGAFEDVAPALGLASPSAGRGASWGDCDNDGDLDLFVATTAADLLYKNTNGTFVESAAPLGLSDPASVSRSALWVDYDNDSDLDLYVSNLQGTANRLWRNGGLGNSWSDAAPGLGIASTGPNWGAAWADFDRDGDVDLYQTRKNQANSLYKNNGSSFTDVAASLGVSLGGWSRAATWADYNGDNWPDLHVVCDSASILFRNNAGTSFTNVTTAAGLWAWCYGRGAAWGDYDNDGDLDLFAVSDGPSHMFVNNGNSTFSASEHALGLGFCGNDYSPVWVDFDGDRDLDVTLASEGGMSRLLRNDGAWFCDVAVLQGTALYGHAEDAAWADYDQDGDLDQFLSVTDDAHRLFRRNGNVGSNWLRVRAAGTISNRAAIGARVRVAAGGTTQTRIVQAGSGWASQGELWPHFYLGAAAEASMIEITWPSGIVDTWLDEPANRTIVLLEGGGGTAVAGAADAPRFPIHLIAVPNPFSGATSIRFAFAPAGAASLVVYDTAGRRVRSLDWRRGAEHAVTWDGRDDAGREVAAGHYCVRLDASNATRATTVICLR